jgi:hypothetical protein
MTYAKNTKVTPASSRAEIERDLAKYGADAFGYASDPPRAAIAFRLNGTHYRISIDVPDIPTRAAEKWRALAMVIKAKLVGVSAGVEAVENAFLADMVMPNGETVGEWVGPQMARAYKIGAMPDRLMIEGPRS